MESFGDKIKAIRLAQNRTQEDIAFELEMTISAYSKIERGQTNVNLSRILQIAKVLKMPVSEIFSFGEEASGIKAELEKLQKENIEKEKMLIKKDREIIELQRQLIQTLSQKKKR